MMRVQTLLHGLPMTTKSLQAHLRWAQELGLERLDAQMLLLFALGQSPHQRAWLLAHEQEELDTQTADYFAHLCARRADHEPLAYLIGEKEFFGLRLSITPSVLDPRADTEALVEWALALMPENIKVRVLDLGTGSGAIALALQRHRPTAHILAIDQSRTALQVAQHNARALSLPIETRCGSWFTPLGAAETFDLIVSNPPYIAANDAHLLQLQHEPPSALQSGVDGLDDIRHIIAHAPAHLGAGGHLLLEHGFNQGPAVRALLADAGFADIRSVHDIHGQERCSGGQLSVA